MEQNKGDKIVAGINQATEVIGTLVPTVAALGGLVRLIATAVRPSDAQKAQEFDDAIAAFDNAKSQLDVSVDGFEQAKAQALQAEGKAELPSGKPVTAMKTAEPGGKKGG